MTGFVVLGLLGAAGAATIPGGGSKRNDCAVTLQADGLAFPAGKARVSGVSCADGGPCDADGAIDGVCHFLVAFCTNTESEALAACGPSEVRALAVQSGKLKGGGRLDLTQLDGAAASLGLPTSETVCGTPATVAVPVRGPDQKGELASGMGKIKTVAATSRGKDKDQFQLVCRPSNASATTTTTSVPATTTTSTAPTGTPGPGLNAAIQSAQVDAAGTVTVVFSLTDEAGIPVTPQSAAIDPPDASKARVRFAIARLEVVDETVEGFTTTFTRWQNYVLNSRGMPAYDQGGATAFAPAGEPGLWTYTFRTQLPAGYDATRTHRVAAQIQRTVGSEGLVANPVFDFVPAGGEVTIERNVTSTAQCNQCHNPLQAHGTGRREVRLCQTCHTDQWSDPDTGASIDFKNMIHRIHHGKELPSVTEGPLGAAYGFGNTHFGEKVAACQGGALAGLPCMVDADCPSGTCTGETTVGVGFPRDIRNCTTCHAVTPDSEQADNWKTKPSARACTGCHDDVNPGEQATDAGAPGTNHVAGDQPDALCRLCHAAVAGEEFDETVPGAHVIPARSAELAGLRGEIVAVSGSPGGPIALELRLINGDGSLVTSVAGYTIALTASGPSTDFGATTPPFVRATMLGGGATGTFTGPNSAGNFEYTSSVVLPADAAGTWRIGLEVRRPVTLAGGRVVTEFAQNPVASFSVDGSPVGERREVVAQENCASCHGTFSVDFSIHGGARNRVEYCVLCHNANVTDFDRRRRAVGLGVDPVNEPMAFKHVIHKIHRGEDLEHRPYVVYGFGAAPANFTPHDFAEVLFPGDLRDCTTCHTDGSQLLPLSTGLLPTRTSTVDTSGGPAVELVTGVIPPVQDACLSCHDSDAAAAHAETNTTSSGAEACNVCHAEGSVVAVSEAHAR
ncbi:MAG TPA: OmcA/MtrC family decaheme c-type cytochrome [Candidatus Limnocylindria bacterium]|nr:OmcA/MtrC family decaheme c-type cytochrome [Candidatus Limnocylindria bacterium]